jgi:hypothetical protein
MMPDRDSCRLEQQGAAKLGAIRSAKWLSVEKGRAMTWGEIKQAVEQAGVTEDEEICVIQCENGDGDHTFHKVKLGRTLKLAENISEEASRREAKGCAV